MVAISGHWIRTTTHADIHTHTHTDEQTHINTHARTMELMKVLHDFCALGLVFVIGFLVRDMLQLGQAEERARRQVETLRIVDGVVRDVVRELMWEIVAELRRRRRVPR